MAKATVGSKPATLPVRTSGRPRPRHDNTRLAAITSPVAKRVSGCRHPRLLPAKISVRPFPWKTGSRSFRTPRGWVAAVPGLVESRSWLRSSNRARAQSCSDRIVLQTRRPQISSPARKCRQTPAGSADNQRLRWRCRAASHLAPPPLHKELKHRSQLPMLTESKRKPGDGHPGDYDTIPEPGTGNHEAPLAIQNGAR